MWTRWSDEALLDLRFRDLGLKIEGTELEHRVERLYDELERRGIVFRPHVWLSSEWFSPDGVPGIAAPFYLAHPRLMKLEARQMLEVDGGTEKACMRVLRHEAGHAIDTAYRLHFKKNWRQTFGSYSKRYPKSYRPQPNSRNFVLHLDAWYAQAHPAEDFAETFAVWLRPRSDWRRRYADWPVALRKLEQVDELMGEIQGRPPVVNKRNKIEPLSRLSETLREYYVRKRELYGTHWPDNYDRDLRKLFSGEAGRNGRPSAATFLRANRTELRETVAEWTGAHAYTVDQVLQDMIERSRELKLRLGMAPKRAKSQAVILVTVHTMNCLHAGRQEIPL
ncbi:MAG: hypothetical protein GY716_20765 [bacterium]|nr:hypothetical protein [bacterium]